MQEKLDAYKAQSNPHMPPEFGPIIGRTIGALTASGQAERWRAYGEQTVRINVTVSPGGWEHFFPTIQAGGLRSQNSLKRSEGSRRLQSRPLSPSIATPLCDVRGR